MNYTIETVFIYVCRLVLIGAWAFLLAAPFERVINDKPFDVGEYAFIVFITALVTWVGWPRDRVVDEPEETT